MILGQNPVSKLHHIFFLVQELQAIRDVASDSFGSSYRRLLYGALSIVMTSALWSTATGEFRSGMSFGHQT